MASITQPRARKHKPPEKIDYDLQAARRWLRDFGAAMREAAVSPDPRVVYLGVQLARHQGADR
jgi:hypothetical protein